MYQFINWANGESGLGRGEGGSIIADDKWWDKYAQVFVSFVLFSLQTILDNMKSLLNSLFSCIEKVLRMQEIQIWLAILHGPVG